MRLVATACAIAVLAGAAIAGVVLGQIYSGSEHRASEPVLASSSAVPGVAKEAADPTVGMADKPAPAAQSAAPAPTVMAQAAPKGAAPAPAAAPTPAPAPAAAGASCPGNPNALGVSRTVEIDTTGGPGFGFEHFKTYDFLREGEVVLTFDDGPWPKNTPAVLAALAAHCTKAIFFPIGIHATWEPQILKQVAAAG